MGPKSQRGHHLLSSRQWARIQAAHHASENDLFTCQRYSLDIPFKSRHPRAPAQTMAHLWRTYPIPRPPIADYEEADHTHPGQSSQHLEKGRPTGRCGHNLLPCIHYRHHTPR